MTTTGVNTIATKVYRDKYRLSTLDKLLRAASVAEKVMIMDRTGAYTIQSPYGSQPTPEITGITGTYTVADYTTTNSTLEVVDEIKIAEHVYDFEKSLTNFDLFANRADEQAAAFVTALDKIAVNGLCGQGTGTYTTPAGGFTTAANVLTICASLLSKVAGYSEAYNGLYCIIEATDLVGVLVAGGTSGYSFADNVLNNGKVNSIMGIDFYVKLAGTFVTATVGTVSYTNDAHRVFGVKNMATLAVPTDIHFEEKAVSGKTGMEVVTYGYTGVEVWGAKAALTVDITLA